MARGPSFRRSRRRSRQERLRRTLFGIAGLVALAVGYRTFGGGDPPLPVEQVAFAGLSQTEGSPRAGDADQVAAEAAEIRAFLDGWYQQAFVDPDRYGDLSFLSVTARFDAEAGAGFVEDRNALTIGTLAERVRSVSIREQVANVVVYFEDDEPVYATAAVLFRARVRLNDHSFLRLKQAVTLVLERRTDAGWVVTNYYDAELRADSMPATYVPPTP